jgi:hypothetical protein
MKTIFLNTLFLLGLCAGAFAQPTIDATLGTNEYGTGNTFITSNGSDWYLTWDDNNLYGFINNANQDESGIIYFDFDNNAIVNSSNGLQTGVAYDDITATAPFNADAVMYFNNAGREVRVVSSGVWGTATNSWGSYVSNDNSNGSGTDDRREFSIPWTTLGLSGRPTVMNFFCYIQYRTGSGSPKQFGGVYAQIPIENPTPTTSSNQTLSLEMVRYFNTPAMGSTPLSNPFSNNSYTHIGADITGFGGLSAYNFTMNSGGKSITRGSGISGIWDITGAMYINAGAIDFGATVSACNINNLEMTGGTLTLSNASGGNLSVTGNWTRVSAATFLSNNRTVRFIGTSQQNLLISDSGIMVFSGVEIDNTAGVILGTNTNVHVDADWTFTNGNFTIGSNSYTLNGDLIGSSSTKNFVLNGNSNFSVGGTGTPSSSLFFDQTTPNVSNRLNNFILNRSAGTITLGDTMQVKGVVTHTNGTLASTSATFLKLKATDSTTYGQVSGVGNGDITGTIQAEFYINGGAENWRQICSPFTGNTLADLIDDININFGTPNATFQNVFYLDETMGGAAGAWRPAANLSASMDDLGYTIFLQNASLPALLDLAGTYTKGNYTTGALTLTGSITDTSGYHLIRNPWPSNYAHSTTVTNLAANTIYLYEGNTIRDYNGTTNSLTNGVVPPFHAIYVQIASNNATLTLPAASRITTGNANLFNKGPIQNYIAMKVINPNNEWDETRIYTDGIAQNGKDFWDAKKLMNAPTAPSVYTLIDGNKTSINVLNNIPEEGIGVPVGFETTIPGTRVMYFTTENIDPRYEIVLNDKWAGKKHKVANGPYTFEHTPNTTEPRFVMNYERILGVSVAEIIGNSPLYVGSFKNMVTLSSAATSGECLVEVTDFMRRCIVPQFSVDFSQSPVNSFTVNGVAAGFYIVKVNGKAFNNTAKVFLQ